MQVLQGEWRLWERGYDMETIALHLDQVEDMFLAFSWEKEEDATSKVFWSDRYSETMTYKCVYEDGGNV